VRKQVNAVIRHNYGLPGLRFWRQLNKDRHALLRKVSHLRRIAATAKSPEKRQEAAAQLPEVLEALRQVRAKQVALVVPQAVRVNVPGAPKPEPIENTEPFWKKAVRKVTSLWRGND
jgi:hypothetical protein